MTASLIHYLASTDSHSTFAQRLTDHLNAFGYELNFDDVLDYVVTDFEQCDFDYAQQLLGCEPHSWHLIWLGPAAGSIIERNDLVSVARSQRDALSSALSEMDTARIFPDEVLVQNMEIEFRCKGSLVLRIQPVPFEPYSAHNRHRVEKALKGILAFGPDDRACKRLASLPGLSSISGRARDRDSDNNGITLIKTAANLASGLRNRLKELFDVNLKQHQVQELLASSLGAKNWAHLVSGEDEGICRTLPVMLSTVESRSDTDKLKYRFYRTAGEGIWSFAATLDSWSGEAIGAVQYSGKTLDGGCPYIHAHFHSDQQIDRHDWLEDACSVAPAMEVYPDPGYDSVASFVLANPVETAARLSQVLQLDASDQTKLSGSNSRLGISTDENMELGDWVFSIRRRGYSHPMLFAEQFNGAGVLIRSHYTQLNKAEIQFDAQQALCIVVGDNGRTDDIVLPNFAVSHVERLVDFCSDYCTGSIERPAHPRFSQQVH
ncbi:hypothetical protein [Undibacterium sp. TS12]|uniref:hypothetical protein n=1 Tax=Undibacterium sp. TS12 TaxID=2908202 RepID=UPI001F4D1FB6|nr:hypothetical protein [Undibacterium sp. TS12]MCH8618046.1 hypothetical protein [Undibacterium sp. TS12]